MKLELLLFLMIAAGAVGTACGSDGGSSMPPGSGGAGSTSTATAATSGQTGVGTGSTGTSGSGSGSGGGGGGVGGSGPVDCAVSTTCGNFGAGCIKCAAKTACAAEYKACFDDAPCKAYSLCIEPCGAKDIDCLQICANQSAAGATEYQALSRCVICGDCVTLCDHAPDTCN